MATYNEFKQLTRILRFQTLPGFFYAALMASSDIDQKFLGRFAKESEDRNPYLSSMLFKILGLSVLLSKKLLRARRLRRLDTTRDTKSMQLYHHIIWLSREGLVITEQYILPMVDDYAEMKVLANKLQASFYHIFVLFHNQPSINQASIPAYRAGTLKVPTPSPDQGGPVQQGALPPGLAPISIPKPSGSFLLPAVDYIPTATTCFAKVSAMADDLLTGSHPIRASVKVEYSAFLYDCVRDSDASRKLAQSSLRDVYTDTAGMDDDMFEETAKLVVILDKMSKRGLGSSSQGSSQRGSATPSTPGAPVFTGQHPSLPSPSRRSPAIRTPVQQSPVPNRKPVPQSPSQARTTKKGGNGSGNGNGGKNNGKGNGSTKRSPKR